MLAESANIRPRVLHVVDKVDRRAELKNALEREGYEYICVPDVEALGRILAGQSHDLIIVEQSASWSFGDPVIERVRQTAADGVIPIIAVGREEESDELVALALGADDYVPHGSVNRLLARIRAAIRRRRSHREPTQILEAGPLKLDEERYQAYVDGRAIYLTPSEFKLLHEIVSANGRVVHRDRLLVQVFGVTSQIESRRIDVHIVGLRKKLGTASDWLQTIRMLGYVWREPIPSAQSQSA